MAKGRSSSSSSSSSGRAENYQHSEATAPLRPDVGVQAQFKKKMPPQTYEYDPARSPMLDWSGKAERTSFEVPTLPLFVHERLSTKAIIETLTGHKRDKQQTLFDLFADPKLDVVEQVLRAYEHRGRWVNRLILADSLVAMNSLLHFEGLGGQVQMIFMDPPYGVKFGSNFQPFVRNRDVAHGDDDDLTREPEMVQAYRDTWEYGLHSYLTYLRDRLWLSRDLLSPSGSIFVQIGDENVHHVRELMDEVFKPKNFCAQITFAKTSSATGDLLSGTVDYLLWYARDIEQVKYRQPFRAKLFGAEGAAQYDHVEEPNGKRRPLTSDEKAKPETLPAGSRIYRLDTMTSQRPPGDFPVTVNGKTYRPKRGYWKTGEEGMKRLIAARRLEGRGDTLCYVRYIDDFPAFPIANHWNDTQISGFADPKLYVVQTTPKVVQRCIQMTTDPGDLVLDPTCGSGTSPYVAELWGRRWIAIDVSRVPLALARQRLLTATFPWHELQDESRGPAGGFVYKRKKNRRGDEVGGLVPHVTLKGIANDEPPGEEVMVDRPEAASGITRVTGPFTVEGTVPPPVEWIEEDAAETTTTELDATFATRLVEVLRRTPVLRVEGNKTVTFKNVRPAAKALALAAEAVVVNGKERLVAFAFGPENGTVSEKLVYEAAREAHAKDYKHLYVIGFGIQPNARLLVEQSEAAVGVPATYVQATPDLLMGNLLKNMRSSQVFSVCGLPEVKLRALNGKGKGKAKKEPESFQATLLALDVFDPVTMEVDHVPGSDVPAWFLDTDYNNLCFHVCQAFFPKTGAWAGIKKALRGAYDESVWDHLAGTTSAPFPRGDHGQIAVKVIDQRGNELLVVKKLSEAEA